MAIDIDREMKRIYFEWCNREGFDSGVAATWLAFVHGWQESSLFAAKAQEDERRWIKAGRPDDWEPKF